MQISREVYWRLSRRAPLCDPVDSYHRVTILTIIWSSTCIQSCISFRQPLEDRKEEKEIKNAHSFTSRRRTSQKFPELSYQVTRPKMRRSFVRVNFLVDSVGSSETGCAWVRREGGGGVESWFQSDGRISFEPLCGPPRYMRRSRPSRSLDHNGTPFSENLLHWSLSNVTWRLKAAVN